MPGIFQKLFSRFFKATESAPKRPEPSQQSPATPPSRAQVSSSAPVAGPLERQSEPALPAAPPKAALTPPPAIAAPITKISQTEAIVDLHIGLDLGTSCSKIAIGDSFLDQYYGVHFDSSAEGIAQYLFPTRFYEAAQGTSLHFQHGASRRSDLKLRLMEAVQNPSDMAEAQTDLAIYLALLLNHAFCWFERHHAKDHRTRRCCWWLNVGFPAKRVENNPQLSDAYTTSCRAAVRAADSGEPISRALVRRFIAGDDVTRNGSARLADDRIKLYPEIAAQLAGYAYSPYRRDGPLLLIDIGAGTLDVSTLILHQREGEEVCSFHFCEVAPLGAFRLYLETRSALNRVASKDLRTAISAGDDPSWHVPISPNEYLGSNALMTASIQRTFQETQNSFASRCVNTCHSNFALFKAYLDQPAVSQGQRPRAFRQQVNFILSGGGSRSQFYLGIFPKVLEESLLNLTSWIHEPSRRRSLGQGLHQIRFMQPDKFRANGISADDFDRMSVAHGLSMGADTLLKITAKEMSDRQWHQDAAR